MNDDLTPKSVHILARRVRVIPVSAGIRESEGVGVACPWNNRALSNHRNSVVGIVALL